MKLRLPPCLLAFTFILLIGFLLSAKASDNSPSWRDTLQKYLRTPPQVSIENLAPVLSEKSLKQDTVRLDMLFALVNDYAQTQQTQIAFETAENALKLAKELKDSSRLARAHLSLAWVERDRGNVETVLELALIAKEMAIKANNKRVQSMAANTLASVYYDLKDDSLQKHYLLESYNLESELNNGRVGFVTLSNLGYVYLKEGDNQKALDMFQASIDAGKSQGATFIHLYLNYSHIIDAYEKINDYVKCVVYCDTIVNGWRVIGNTDEVIRAKTKRAFYQSLSGQSVNANELLKQFNSIDESKLPLDSKKALLANKARFNEHFGNYKRAFEFQKAYHAISDSLTGSDLRDKIAFYKEQFDAEKRENKIAQLESEKELALLQDEVRKSQMIGLFVGLILTISFILYLIVIYRKLAKTKAELQSANEVKDKFFAIVSHDLKNSVTSFQDIGMIINAYINQQRWSDLKNLGEKLDLAADKLSAFLNNMLGWSMSQLGRIPYQPKKVSISEKVNDAVELMHAQIDSKTLNLQLKVQDNHHAFVDEQAIALILRNLLSNAIKYSNPNGEVIIESTVENKRVQISITDSGAGMTQNQIDRLFNPAGVQSQKGTLGEEGTGLGLVLVQEFVQINKGTIQVSSKLGEGSRFVVTLPLDS